MKNGSDEGIQMCQMSHIGFWEKRANENKADGVERDEHIEKQNENKTEFRQLKWITI